MRTPPRVLHIVPSLFSSEDGVIGGAERYVLELARHMSAETEVTLATFGQRERVETIDRLKIRVIGNPWYVRGQRNNPIALALVRELLNAEVIHCHQQHVLASSLAAFASNLTRKRVFVSDLGGGGWDISGYISTDGWYDGHLHISEYSRKVFGHESRANAYVIMGGVDTEKFSPNPAVARDGSVLFVGRLLPHKGISDLINAVQPEMSLQLIGQSYDDRFLADMKKLSAGKQVHFRHDCDDVALVQAYRRALCVVLPSVYETIYGDYSKVPELLGQTLLEGMACGTPAICTDVASMPEIVIDGVTGFVVPPNDPSALGEKLTWLSEHPSEARRLGETARQHVLERFTWPRVVKRCLEIYEA